MNGRSLTACGSLCLLLGAGVAACGSGAGSGPEPGRTWLADEREQQLVQLERHLRGFDVAMLETGYRYVELERAGRAANWPAAAYHAGKLRLAIENGSERRPKRAKSAQRFLDGPLTALDAAVAARDATTFGARFADLTAGCNACHDQEQVPFLAVHPPEIRLSPLWYGEAR